MELLIPATGTATACAADTQNQNVLQPPKLFESNADADNAAIPAPRDVHREGGFDEHIRPERSRVPLGGARENA